MILKWTIGILFVYTVVSFLTVYLFQGNVDFPWFLKYDADAKSITFRHRMNQTTEETAPQIECYLDVYFAHYGGLGADYHKSNTNILQLRMAAANVELRREGDELFINNRTLPEGQEYMQISYFHLHPWLKTRLTLQNLGLVTIKHIVGSKPRIVLYGRYGTEFASGKGSLILAALAIIMICLWIRSRRMV